MALEHLLLSSILVTIASFPSVRPIYFRTWEGSHRQRCHWQSRHRGQASTQQDPSIEGQIIQPIARIVKPPPQPFDASEKLIDAELNLKIIVDQANRIIARRKHSSRQGLTMVTILQWWWDDNKKHLRFYKKYGSRFKKNKNKNNF